MVVVEGGDQGWSRERGRWMEMIKMGTTVWVQGRGLVWLAVIFDAQSVSTTFLPVKPDQIRTKQVSATPVICLQYYQQRFVTWHITYIIIIACYITRT